MKIISIEPTPSPNSMKINLDENLPKGIKRTYTQKDSALPAVFRSMLDIPGVTSVFHTADFIAVDRTPKGDWELILSRIRTILGSEEQAGEAPEQALPLDSFGEANVLVQMFRSIPMQIRVRSGMDEARRAMPERFVQAAMKAGSASPNLIRERHLEDNGVRYGDIQEIADLVVQELDASYNDERLAQLVAAAEASGADAPAAPPEPKEELTADEVERLLDDPDWKVRYAALQQMKPTLEKLPLLAKALADPQSSVRRLASVYIGDVREPEALPYLFQALQDDSVSVRRTAGDTLSDIGDPAAIGPMIRALSDKNKLVRWRAARFLYETGDETALPALREAADDAEFEVRMQVKIAIERIEGGAAAEGSVWQQMTRRNETT
ncbi:conserved virulence factor C family protein [Paenibacillus ginsengarvi]|uniref:Virulence factor n=1 Tax=Paenibacillus ginsengarvi TaxID=400777 RepID=A0A3B0ALA9_9BACL|nr:conserved virulence factor C family protein [Paenibacillus ginsengarvi]RKN61390.1 virulence factor [Paenibacillus ginsengarvi]